MWVSDSEGGVYLIKALLDLGSSSKLIGIVSLKVNNNIFFSMIKQSGYLGNGILIVDGDDNIIIHKTISDAALDAEIVEAAQTFEKQSEEVEFVSTTKYFMTVSQKLQNDWTLYYYINRNEITADVHFLIVTDVILAVFLFVISYLIATKYASRLSEKLGILNDMARNIRGGNFNVSDKIAFKDEIGQLSDSMVDMANQHGGKDNIAVILIEPFADGGAE